MLLKIRRLKMLTAKIDKNKILPVLEEINSIEDFDGEEYVEVDEDVDNQSINDSDDNKS